MLADYITPGCRNNTGIFEDNKTLHSAPAGGGGRGLQEALRAY